MYQGEEVAKQKDADEIHEIHEQETKQRYQLQAQHPFLGYGQSNEHPHYQQDRWEVAHRSQGGTHPCLQQSHLGIRQLVGIKQITDCQYDKWYRENKRIETTGELNEIIARSIPAATRRSGGHPSKRTYQAIRIELNKELTVLEQSIEDMIDVLNPGGRLCIITFHSLEDRIVKNAFKTAENPCTCPPEFPVCVCGKASKGRMVSKKPIIADANELQNNPRSSSAKLRVFEKK